MRWSGEGTSAQIQKVATNISLIKSYWILNALFLQPESAKVRFSDFSSSFFLKTLTYEFSSREVSGNFPGIGLVGCDKDPQFS